MESNIFFRVRSLGRHVPLLKRVFLPVWPAFTHGCWRLRNLLTNRRPIKVATEGQTLLLHPAGQIAEVLWVADFEAAERQLIARITKPDMCVFNVGANIGLYTIMTGKLVGPGGEVHAFEPSSITYERLERNVRLNGLTNVTPNHIALSDTPGTLVLRSDPNDQSLDGHRFVEPLTGSAAKAGDEVIPCDTLDRYFLRSRNGAPPRPIDLMIMDVEGAELNVFQGGLETLRASPDVVLVLECSKNRREMKELLVAEGFEFFTWDATAATFSPAEFVAAASIGNVLACRSSARRRLA